LREAQIAVKEITEDRYLSNILKECLKEKMPVPHYLKISEMTISEMLQNTSSVEKLAEI